MKRWIHATEDIVAMSNVRGKFVVVENIPFSFYYSVRNSNHGPRVKVTMNGQNMRPNRMSSLKLCNDWSIDINDQDARISAKDLATMKEFFRKYLVLFLIVWEDLISEPELADYFEGKVTLKEFIQDTDFYNEYSRELDDINSVSELETFCRDNNLINFYAN